MKVLVLDTAPLLYAIGSSHPLREPCRRIIETALRQEVELHVSAEAVQEVLHHRLRRGDRASAVTDARDVAALCVIHPLDAAVLDAAITLVASTPLRGRDAVHAATALLVGAGHIVSTDQAFAAVDGLRLVDPADALL